MPIDDQDPRSKERFQWIEKFRKVKPMILESPKTSAQHDATPRTRTREVTSGLEPYTGPWEEAQARHLLARTLFGIKKYELDHFKGLSAGEAVDKILTPSEPPPPPVNDYNGIEADAVDPNVKLGESWLQAPHGGDKEGYRVVSLKTWQIKNIIRQETNIHEKMILFWNNLLVTKVWDVYIAKASFHYYDMLRRNALGNYKSLIRELTLDPSMLIFLNGTKNAKGAPDENFGRELQELFCIGKGPGSKYTEGDVQAAARVLTGWGIDWTPYDNAGTFKAGFYADRHDDTDKQFSSFYNNKIITGNGANELDDLLDMIIGHEETSKYICRRLYSFFVYNDISETVEQNVIEPLAEIFRSNDYEITPVLRALFTSEHFYDPLNKGVLIKSPAEHLLGLWKTFDVKSSNENELPLNYIVRRSMHWHMANLGMEMGDPPNVAGWTPYYQAPQYDKAWITTDTITKRAITTDSLLYWGFWISSEIKINADIIGFVYKLDDPSNPSELLKESATLLLGLDLSDTVMNNLKSVLLSGQLNDAYWTTAWNDFKASPSDPNKKSIVQSRLQATFKQMLQLGEYHLM
ncbi:MAG: DUF1800 domain-containing protein [Bacteroidetes bacterium]|nr:DUF1800 domain-containing protein [Bacteroidota bacterium]